MRNGEQISFPHFDVYEVYWPKDESPLSNKRIELFFDHNEANFPFPYWAKVTDASDAAFKIRILDSGKHLPSPKKELPRRAITFAKQIEESEEGVSIFLNVPKYYEDLKLFALSTNKEAKPIAIPFSVTTNGEERTLFITQEKLKKTLKKGSSYTLLIKTESPVYLSIESTKKITP